MISLSILSRSLRFTSGSRLFHNSGVFYEESRYLINGTETTRTEVMAMHPTERTVAHWSILIDWDLQRTRNYVIVDPLDPSGLLYLNQAEYLAQSKVCASNDLMLIVVARPGTKAPVPTFSSSTPSQNSPWGVEIESKWQRQSRLSWKTFLRLRDEVGRIVGSKKGSKMVSVSSETVGRTVYAWVRTLAHYAEVKNPGTYVQYFIPFVRHLQVLLKNNGQMEAVKFLKVSLFSLYSYVSGNPLEATIPLGHGIRLRNGLPAVWDRNLRDRIRKGDVKAIRLLASLLNLYRALDAKHPDFDVSTIVKPHPDFSQNETFKAYQKFCKEVFPTLLAQETGGFKPFRYQSALGYLIRSAGPNLNGPSMTGIQLDAAAWFNRPDNLILDWFTLHGDTKAVNTITEISKDSHWTQENYPVARQTLRSFCWASRTPLAWPEESACSSFNDGLENVPKGPILGRLHAINEPAGKVRIVAICDYWTQVALKPIHDFLFSILKEISSDATFDQSGRVESYFQKGLSPHWSFDLKAATDSIPLALYKACLTPLLKQKGEDDETAERRTNLWASILTDRDFLLPDSSSVVRYGTGQPMGALSSWASMAIVHHSLVQFSAINAGLETTWYKDYLVLGDDVDIATKTAVADGYQSVCNDLSITIGLLKSLRSEKNCFEFANRRFYPDGDISPLSLKEELAALTWTGRLEYAKRILARFGTSLKDGSSALLRKASTPAQWKVLGAELSGLRSTTLVDLCRFCLLTPFKDLKELRIDSVLNWLALVTPKESKSKLISILESAEQRAKLEREVAIRLLDDLVKRVETRLARVPRRWDISIPKGKFEGDPILWTGEARLQDPDFQRASNEATRRFPEIGFSDRDWLRRAQALDMRLRQLFETTSGGYNETIGKQAMASLLYLGHCVNVHNDRVRNDLESLAEKIRAAARRFNTEGPMQHAYDHAMMMYPATSIHPFTSAFELWEELMGVPQEILPTPCKPGWLKVEEEETPTSKFTGKPISLKAQSLYENRLRAPVGPVTSAIAEVTGILIPFFPYHVWQGKGFWTVALRKGLKAYAKHQHSLLIAELDLWESFAERLETSTTEEQVVGLG